LLNEKSSEFKKKSNIERRTLERERDVLMSTSTKPSSWSEGRKKKIVSVEDKLIAQLSEDIEAERREWESRHIRYYE
jgi:hypothetical protein